MLMWFTRGINDWIFKNLSAKKEVCKKEERLCEVGTVIQISG